MITWRRSHRTHEHPPAGAGALTRTRRAAGRAWRLAEWAVAMVAVVGVLGAVVLMAGPRLLGWEGVIILSGSMEPELKVGGLAFVDPGVAPETIRPGDIITFQSQQDRRQQISHRVVEVTKEGGALTFITKGDANADPDAQPVLAKDVVGKVRFDLPYLGHIANKLRHREVFYAVLGIPAALLILNELLRIGREVRRKESTQ